MVDRMSTKTVQIDVGSRDVADANAEQTSTQVSAVNDARLVLHHDAARTTPSHTVALFWTVAEQSKLEHVALYDGRKNDVD